MNAKRNLHAAFAFAVAVLIAGSLTPTLHGCTSDDSTVKNVFNSVGIDAYRLSEDGRREAARFDAVFREYAADPDNSRQLKHFHDGFKRVRSAYFESVADHHLIDAAISGVEEQDAQPRSMPAKGVVEAALDAMLATLDPHSSYLNPEELQESELVSAGEFGGLGIQVTHQDGLIRVISPLEGTPADRGGIQPGDLITHLDGQPMAGRSLKDAVNGMRGRPGTQIRLTIRRGERAPFDVTLTRAIITIEPVRWQIVDGVGYLRIVGFNEKTAERLEASFTDMFDSRPRIKGIVLDLRNNPGGLLDQSLAVADAFLDEGVIVSIRGRDPAGERHFAASEGDIAAHLPVVVIVNGGSASAAEIVAAALQDHGRAVVMGAPSFGKGSVQTVMRLPEGGAIKLTTALYYTPLGRAIQARGVLPDVRLIGGPTVDEPETHEADLPRAIKATSAAADASKASINIAACPPRGEANDRVLGCAIGHVLAGSTDRFLASLPPEQRL